MEKIRIFNFESLLLTSKILMLSNIKTQCELLEIKHRFLGGMASIALSRSLFFAHIAKWLRPGTATPVFDGSNPSVCFRVSESLAGWEEKTFQIVLVKSRIENDSILLA